MATATGLSSHRAQPISGCIGKQKPSRNPDTLYAAMTRLYPSPIVVQGVYGYFCFLFSVQNSAGSEQELLVERRTGKDYLVSKAGYCEGLGSMDSDVKV